MGRRVNLSLSGAWSGEYRYPSRYAMAPVSFVAELVEHGDGALTGHMDEPNTFGDSSTARLFASLSGSRTGSAVTFLKCYTGAGGVDHTVAYEGTANAQFTEITGRWAVNWFSGSFVMTRDTTSIEQAIDRAQTARE